MKGWLGVLAIIHLASVSFAWGSIPNEIQGISLNQSGLLKRELNRPGKTTVLVFISAKCPCSISHERVLEELAREFRPDGFEFIGIQSNVDVDPEFARAHFQASGFSFPVIHDPGAKLANDLGALKTPHVFVVKNQEVVFSGGIDETRFASEAKKPYLKQALLALRAGKLPDPKVVRVLGCMIERP